nr:sodium:alanine symporter family protein [uncultured Caproiciproducens sp.]
MLNSVLTNLDSFLWGAPFTLFVIGVGLYFLIRSGFFPLAHFHHMMHHTMGSLTSKETHNKKAGQTTPFEAICIAVGGSVGCGCIGGIATAVAVGGPGAVFWMWVFGLVAMMVKMVEITLGCHYRSKNEKGEYFGGATYYMEKGIGREQKHKYGFALAWLFGIGFVAQFLGGSQAYTISEVLNTTFHFNMIVVTLIYSAFVFYIIYKGVPRIGAVAKKLVPFKCVAFLVGGVLLMILNYQNLPSVFYSIFHDAFNGSAALGGFGGATIMVAMRNGVARGLNSNEAGQGSSPQIQSTSNTVHPVRQGLWGCFEVFVDTFIVCSITALSILVTGVLGTGKTGATLTIAAFQTDFGIIGPIFIALMCVMFGITTTSGWFTYYVSIINHGLRYKPILRDKVLKVFKFLYPIPNIIIVSSIVLTGNGPDLFWTIVDLTLVIPVFGNLLGLICLRKKFWSLLKDYKARYLGVGEVDPNFNLFYEDDPKVAAEEEAIREEARRITSEAYAKSNKAAM